MNARAANGPDLRGQALCANTDADAFFPEPGGSPAAAKAVCAQCEVQVPCLTWALENREWGVWGNTTAEERAKLGAPATLGPQPINHGTESGWRTHRRRGERPCAACVEGNRTSAKAKRAVA